MCSGRPAVYRPWLASRRPPDDDARLVYTLDELYAATQPKKIQQLIQQLLGGGGAARSKLSPFMQFCTARRAEWKARPPHTRAGRGAALLPRLCPGAPCAQAAPPGHSAWCSLHRCAVPSASTGCLLCSEQAAGEKYAVPEQGKMLGAEWKSLTDKDKDKYI